MSNQKLNKLLNSENALLAPSTDFKEIIEKIEKVTNLKLNGYREEYLTRRILYHLAKNKITDFNNYFDKLLKDEALLHSLIDCLTVNVSSFFRDKHSFDYLQKEVLSSLAKQFNYLRIWSLGCSVGAEIYSIALLLNSAGLISRCELIGSDNDSGALNRAISGIFNASEIKNLPYKYMRFFDELERDNRQKTWMINSHFKETVTFIKHDLTACTPLSGYRGMRKFHLLVCRNVVIYFSCELKEKLYELFYEWLEPGGVLFVGANESVIGPAKSKFKLIHNQFYKKPL